MKEGRSKWRFPILSRWMGVEGVETREGVTQKSTWPGTLGWSSKLMYWGQGGFCPFSSWDFRRELLCSMDFLWPQEHYEAEWYGQEELSLDSYMMWMLSRDSLGSMAYGAQNHCGLQQQREFLRGGQIGREGHWPWQLKKTRPWIHQL